MVVGKVITKLIQSLPTWEVTKYYGRVCWFQLKCLKYRMQTSEAWFNFKCKFMPGSLRNEIECEDIHDEKGKEKYLPHKQHITDDKKKELSDILICHKQNQQRYQDMDKNDISASTSLESLDNSCRSDEHRINQKKARVYLHDKYKHISKENVKNAREKVKRYQ